MIVAVERAGLDEMERDLSAGLEGRITRDQAMAPYTSFNVGGPADLFIEPRTLRDLAYAVRILRRGDWPLFVLGNGTNCLVSDRGIRAAVISLRRTFRSVRLEGTRVLAGAGVSMPLLSNKAAHAGLSGYEWACGVPGSVGGSVIMNAGAHGGDTAGCVDSIQVVTPVGDDGWMSAAELDFQYRHSALVDSGTIVTAVRYHFQPDDPAAIQDRLQEYRDRRRAAQPETSQCAGSIFKNPPGGSAGRLLDSLGAKGMRVGRAEVSEKHANFIVNAGGALASEVRTLISQLQELARDRAGVVLEPEVLMVGDWPEPGAGPRSDAGTPDHKEID